MSKKVLVVAPHPDDEIIGCGGSIAKHLAQGNEVFVVYVTSGAVRCPDYQLESYQKVRVDETFRAADAMGIRRQNLYFLCGEPLEVDEQNIRFALINEVRRIKPEACYIPHSDDGHVDHQIVSRAALDAITMSPSPWFRDFGEKVESQPIPIVLAYEVWTPLTKPNYFEDITGFVEKKMEALRCHKTQGVQKYEKAHRGLNAFRGAMHEGGVSEYAEAFQVLKIPKLFW